MESESSKSAKKVIWPVLSPQDLVLGLLGVWGVLGVVGGTVLHTKNSDGVSKKFDDDDVTMMLFSRLGGAEAVAPLPSGRH